MKTTEGKRQAREAELRRAQSDLLHQQEMRDAAGRDIAEARLIYTDATAGIRHAAERIRLIRVEQEEERMRRV